MKIPAPIVAMLIVGAALVAAHLADQRPAAYILTGLIIGLAIGTVLTLPTTRESNRP